MINDIRHASRPATFFTSLLFVLAFIQAINAAPDILGMARKARSSRNSGDLLNFRSTWPRQPLDSQPQARSARLDEHIELDLSKRESFYDTNLNGSKFLWLLDDVYAGKTFFDNFTFFIWKDPTNGSVNYVNKTEAIRKNLTYVQDDGVVIMRADMETTLPLGAYRDSVRIETIKHYTTGLFILDLNRAPWGCAVWPAFWSTNGNWPNDGEIDIIEGVHDNEHNQVTWHTTAGCYLDANTNYTGTLVDKPVNGSVNCDHAANANAGCGVVEWSRASYGPYFEAQGGGVIAMKWDENSIAVWSFYRAAIPKDITLGTPNPSTWGLPSAVLPPTKCELGNYFKDHAIIFDITFCGEWAGNSYATTNCPGTCPERLMEAKNFENATWSINSLKTYRKQPIDANVIPSEAMHRHSSNPLLWILISCSSVILYHLMAL